jgi:hypothetical protein
MAHRGRPRAAQAPHAGRRQAAGQPQLVARR